jgi:hypothetical protein
MMELHWTGAARLRRREADCRVVLYHDGLIRANALRIADHLADRLGAALADARMAIPAGIAARV